ncbi:MAG: hypothetical protein J5610_06300 [Prevotella sp.]|nr:hypothetical protein [Prevotella sp.]
MTDINNIKRTVYYGDGYEEVADDSLGNYSITYLGENIIGVKKDNAVSYYYVLTDHLGSIVGIYNAAGTTVFDATYDAWGQQTVTRNDIGFLRGYTGHEMMPEFKLINMNGWSSEGYQTCLDNRVVTDEDEVNGRLYDPLLARFLSPDNYVQLPDFSQSLNRYSYCLNNPLKYTDPDGEWWGIDDLLIAGVGFVAGYVSAGLSTGHWGMSSVKPGLMTAAMGWLQYNTAGLSSGAITSSTWSTAMSIGANTAINSAIEPMSIPINNHFSISAYPLVGYGEGGFYAGIGSSLNYNSRDFDLSLSLGATNNYEGWNVVASSHGWGAGYGQTSYGEQYVNGNRIGAQRVGTYSVYLGNDVSFSLSNDLFADRNDRWRTSSAELSIGKITVGTYVLTNWGENDSPYVNKSKTDITRIDPIVGGHHISGGEIGAWNNGLVYSAPIWIGYKHHSQIYRIGVSHPLVQHLTQNLVHTRMNTPFFLDYQHFRQGLFFTSGTYTTLSHY